MSTGTLEGWGEKYSRTLVGRLPLKAVNPGFRQTTPRADSFLHCAHPTCSGSYVVRFDAIGDELSLLDAAPPQPSSSTRPEATLEDKGGGVPELSDEKGLTLDERAVVLATAVSSAFLSILSSSFSAYRAFPPLFLND